MLRFATNQIDRNPAWIAPLDLFLTALVSGIIVWIGIDLIEGRRRARPRPRLLTTGANARMAAPRGR